MLDSVIDYVIAWFMSCINHLVGVVYDLVDFALVPAAEALPNLQMQTAFLIDFFGLANQFIALDYGIMLFMAYLVFAMSISLINWVLGLIPFVN